MASIGIEQIKRFPAFAQKRQRLAKQYDQQFTNHQTIQSLSRDYDNVVPHIYVVRILGMKDQKHIRQLMMGKGIEVGYHYQPNHWLSLYKDEWNKPLPVTDSVFPELMTLPLHSDVSEQDVVYVATELKILI